MKADQLIQQYQAGAITARELVEGVWIYATLWRNPVLGCYTLALGPGYSFDIDGANPDEDWQAAAAFTIARIEEITSLKSAIEDANRSIGCEGCEGTPGILIELGDNKLAELSKGIKPEALA
jgi:hypothetical protein